MSKELLALEQRAKQKVITNPSDIGRITEYILEMPFSTLRKDEVNYRRLQNKLSEGFHISCDNLDNMLFGDVLILIGYEPGNTYFDTPLITNSKFGKRFNVAGDVRFIAAILNNLSKCKAIRIKEFMNIGLVPFMNYLYRFVDTAFAKKYVKKEYRSRKLPELERLCKEFCEYVEAGDKNPAGEITVGDLIENAIDRSIISWVCCSVPLDEYATVIEDSYRILIKFFMNGIRMSMYPWPSRNKFCGILKRCGECPQDVYKSIEFIQCFEPHR
ncbi:MAG: hypothetical protein K6F87_08140 [Lachnospiraceae bacterium]|nr:hypothetical protein [Lachnospiraceae bacterium]